MKRPISRFQKLFAVIFACGLGCFVAYSSVVIDSGPDFRQPATIQIKAPPTFAIAEFGFTHDLKAAYDNGFFVIGPGPEDYEYIYDFAGNIPGMTLRADGVVEFLPSGLQIGQSYTVSVEVAVMKKGQNIFSAPVTFTTEVIAEAPKIKLIEQSLWASGYGSRYTYGFDLDLTDDDGDFFRFSLIDPPTGVFLREDRRLAYPLAEFGEGITEVPIRLRYELDTLAGIVFDELEFIQELLPSPPPTGWGVWNKGGSGEGGVIGFSLASGGEWLIAGEPFIANSSPTAPAGIAHVWRFDLSNGNIFNHTILTPSQGTNGEAFGASVAIRDAVGDLPPAAFVGVPEALGGLHRLEPNVGRVDVFERNNAGTWEQVASLPPPTPTADLFAGGWVDASADVLVASLEGANSAGAFTGAAAIYRRNNHTKTWEFAQTLTAPDSAAGNYFGYPSSIDGDWIAVAANEDDEAGLNAGAVHLFQSVNGSFVHQQKLLSPEPQSGALFGERVKLAGAWLFVSAFRQDSGRGAVYVFRQTDGVWRFQHRLEAPFLTEYANFGYAMAVHEDTLSVSASGISAGADVYPHLGVTLYRLIEGRWKWVNHAPSNGFDDRRAAFGFSLAQLTRQHTVVGRPFENLNQGRNFAGRITRLVWPTFTPQTFEHAVAQIGPEIVASGDEDGNGVANLMQWAMGQDINQASWTWRNYPETSRPFAEIKEDRLRLVISPITRGWAHQTDILISTNGRDWVKAANTQWEPLQTYRFGNFQTPMQPITIPWPENSDAVLLRLQLR